MTYFIRRNGAACRLEKNFLNALKLLHEALDLVKHTRAKPTVMMIHRELSEIYQSNQDHQNALKHFRAFYKLREAVFNEESNTTVKNLQIRSEVEVAEKEAEIHRLKYDELAKSLESEMRNWERLSYELEILRDQES